MARRSVVAAWLLGAALMSVGCGSDEEPAAADNGATQMNAVPAATDGTALPGAAGTAGAAAPATDVSAAAIAACGNNDSTGDGICTGGLQCKSIFGGFPVFACSCPLTGRPPTCDMMNAESCAAFPGTSCQDPGASLGFAIGSYCLPQALLCTPPGGTMAPSIGIDVGGGTPNGPNTMSPGAMDMDAGVPGTMATAPTPGAMGTTPAGSAGAGAACPTGMTCVDPAANTAATSAATPYCSTDGMTAPACPNGDADCAALGAGFMCAASPADGMVCIQACTP